LHPRQVCNDDCDEANLTLERSHRFERKSLGSREHWQEGDVDWDSLHSAQIEIVKAATVDPEDSLPEISWIEEFVEQRARYAPLRKRTTHPWRVAEITDRLENLDVDDRIVERLKRRSARELGRGEPLHDKNSSPVL
jgi:hypothetical protein